ncbi:MAG TPA: hypothetical protein VN922_21410 [Bacteroidia bacterium]|nr:hypothetical protein [Bacteroidia bacterium]
MKIAVLLFFTAIGISRVLAWQENQPKRDDFKKDSAEAVPAKPSNNEKGLAVLNLGSLPTPPAPESTDQTNSPKRQTDSVLNEKVKPRQDAK